MRSKATLATSAMKSTAMRAIRRAGLVVLLLAGVASANPGAKRKATPDKFAKAAGEAFAAAVAADQASDLRGALGLYQKAYAISPHPSTIYNIADVQRRLGLLSLAIKSYETYLVLAPRARDRAEIEALIERLGDTPGTLAVVTSPTSDPRAIELASAYVMISGELRRRPGPVAPIGAGKELGIELSVAAGEHTIDLVTAVTYGTRQCTVRAGERTRCELRADPRIDGSVVVSAADRGFQVRTQPRERSLMLKRFELAPGRHKLLLRDRSFECPPLVLDVAGTNTVAYAFVTSSEYDRLERCRALEIKQHRLVFDP